MWSKHKNLSYLYFDCPWYRRTFHIFYKKQFYFLYHILNKPVFAPPKALYPIVWTILYILMGISSARIYLQKSAHSFEVMDTLLNYALQLILNFFLAYSLF